MIQRKLAFFFAQNAVSLVPQISSDLGIWEGAATVDFLSETDNDDGTMTIPYCSVDPVGGNVRPFIRLMEAPVLGALNRLRHSTAGRLLGYGQVPGDFP